MGKKKMSSTRRKHNIIIIGDSHGRDCASRVKYELVNTFEVQGTIRPGAGLMTTKNAAKEDFKNLI
jgi:hypothetical protein